MPQSAAYMHGGGGLALSETHSKASPPRFVFRPGTGTDRPLVLAMLAEALFPLETASHLVYCITKWVCEVGWHTVVHVMAAFG